MIKLVGLDGGQLRPEFVKNEFISFSSVIVVENEGVTKVNSVRSKIRNRENIFDSQLAVDINTFAKHDGRFG